MGEPASVKACRKQSWPAAASAEFKILQILDRHHPFPRARAAGCLRPLPLEHQLKSRKGWLGLGRRGLTVDSVAASLLATATRRVGPPESAAARFQPAPLGLPPAVQRPEQTPDHSWPEPVRGWAGKVLAIEADWPGGRSPDPPLLGSPSSALRSSSSHWRIGIAAGGSCSPLCSSRHFQNSKQVCFPGPESRASITRSGSDRPCWDPRAAAASPSGGKPGRCVGGEAAGIKADSGRSTR